MMDEVDPTQDETTEVEVAADDSIDESTEEVAADEPAAEEDRPDVIDLSDEGDVEPDAYEQDEEDEEDDDDDQEEGESSPSEEEYVATQRLLQQINRAQERVLSQERVVAKLAGDVKEAKETLKERQAHLRALLRSLPQPAEEPKEADQEQETEPESQPAEEPTPLAAEAAELPHVADAWRIVDLNELRLPVKLRELLGEQKIDTLGQLEDYIAERGENALRSINGIGEKHAKTIEDAKAAFWSHYKAPAVETVVGDTEPKDEQPVAEAETTDEAEPAAEPQEPIPLLAFDDI